MHVKTYLDSILPSQMKQYGQIIYTAHNLIFAAGSSLPTPYKVSYAQV
jgi:hypothetical protein